MTTVQCPSCGASAPETADWCSLCYDPLRPEPVVAPLAVPVAASVPVAVPSGAPGAPAASTSLLEGSAPPPGTDPLTAPLSAVDPQAAKATWPCRRCGADVPLSLDACEECGANFLSGLQNDNAVLLPVVGDITKLTQGQRLMLGGMVSLGLLVVLLVIATIGGHIL